MQHTPGPWSYGFPKLDGTELREADCQVSAAGFLVANVLHGGIYPAEPHGSAVREANARLIASAPEMLNALRGLLADDDVATMIGTDATEKLEALVRRAVGAA